MSMAFDSHCWYQPEIGRYSESDPLSLDGSDSNPATYKPFGPLASFTSGNGLTEIRTYDGRYSPLCIQVPGRLDQTYTTDAVGNILRIDRTVGSDRLHLGNRLSEGSTDIDPTPETHLYSYLPNATGGHTPKLSRIQPAPGDDLGSRLDYTYDAAGNETTVTALSGEDTGRTSFLDYSAESRLAKMRTSNGPSSTKLLYDGRGFLRRSRLTATNTNDFEQTEPVYTSEGLLLARRYHKQNTQGGRGDTGRPAHQPRHHGDDVPGLAVKTHDSDEERGHEGLAEGRSQGRPHRP